MINADDLRLGNYVLHEDRLKKIDVIWGKNFVSLMDCPPKTWGSIYTDKFNVNELQPVSITPELLLKNDWVLASGYYVLKSKEVRLGWQPYGEFILGYALFPKKVLYVHELQNIMQDCGLDTTFELYGIND